MLMRTAIAATLVAFAIPALAQDSFVPIGLRSSCEYRYGERCVSRETWRRHHHAHRPRAYHGPRAYHPRPRYRVEERVYFRPSEMPPVTLPKERCLPAYEAVTAQSDPKIYKSARLEAIVRWQGIVSAKHGEIYLDWKRAKKSGDGIVCWKASTGERQTDGKDGRHERCEAKGIPCRGDRHRSGADDTDSDGDEDREVEGVVIIDPIRPTR